MGSEHGGLNYKKLREEGISPDDVLDFSVSINPDPLPGPVVEKVRNSCITRYPDSNCSLLKEKIARYNGMEDTDSILVLNGTSQGMYLLVSALLRENEPVSIINPTFSEYYDACSLKTEHIHHIALPEEDHFHFPVDKIVEHVREAEPRLLWLCSPNNPTGTYLPEEDFEVIRQACLQSGTLLVLDEAYICFVPDRERYNPVREGVIVLRSMTKDFSIPGLRLGYLLGEPSVIREIRKWQPEWSISAPAQDAGIAGFGEIEYFRDSWSRTAQRGVALRDELERLGLTAYPSRSNFFLVKVDDVASLKKHFWKDLILVRDCSSFGLENIIRIGVRTDEDNQRLVRSLREYLKK